MTTTADLFDAVTYLNYAYNRTLQPDISPERWGAIFGEDAARSMEARYQAEGGREARLRIYRTHLPEDRTTNHEPRTHEEPRPC